MSRFLSTFGSVSVLLRRLGVMYKAGCRLGSCINVRHLLARHTAGKVGYPPGLHPTERPRGNRWVDADVLAAGIAPASPQAHLQGALASLDHDGETGNRERYSDTTRLPRWPIRTCQPRPPSDRDRGRGDRADPPAWRLCPMVRLTQRRRVAFWPAPPRKRTSLGWTVPARPSGVRRRPAMPVGRDAGPSTPPYKSTRGSLTSVVLLPCYQGH